jgi:hypothetical protein
LGCVIDIVVTVLEWYQRSRNKVPPARDPEVMLKGEKDAGGERDAGGEQEAAGRDVLLRRLPRWHGAREGDAGSEGEPGGEEELVIEEEVE